MRLHATKRGSRTGGGFHLAKYLVTGGQALSGAVRVSGAKNAVLPTLAAILLTPETCVLHDIPDLRDVQVMMEILRLLGVKLVVTQDETRRHLLACAGSLDTFEIRADLTRQMRSSIFLMGPLLGRLGKVRIAYPGGCAIGPRPIDLHLRGLAALGARIVERYGYIEAEAPRLRGVEIHLDFPSVGATENIMMAAVLADGVTVIRNAAKEPEIVDLQNLLNAMGARVKGAGMDAIRIEGVRRLHDATHNVIPDRIEAGTFMIAAAITQGDVLLENVIPEHVESTSAKLREAGVNVREIGECMRVTNKGRVHAVDIKTLPYPGFPTDMHPQMMALMSVCQGTSMITETVFENRFSQAEELRRMGANIKIEGRTAVISGVEMLSGATVEAADLRSGAALVLAGLVAEGQTAVEGAIHIERGYENLDGKLRGLGAIVERVE